MKNKGNRFLVIASFLMLAGNAFGYHDLYLKSGKQPVAKPNVAGLKAANCAPATAKVDVELNNVRALIETGGSLWQDRANNSAAYFVPKAQTPTDPQTTAIYAGALWMGGIDINGQLKLAAIRFRTDGNDFWPGPLTTIAGSANPNDPNSRDFGPAEIDPDVCADFDKFYEINRSEVELFNGWWEAGIEDALNGTNVQAEDFPGYQVPNSIINWPAHGDVSLQQDFYLAPFFDRDGDGVYNPAGAGDYPWYDLNGEVDCRSATDRRVTLFGDQTFWWVFNDKGNIHTESGADPIGMEIRAQAFAFATNDEVNNMTFYNYEMINRGTQTLFETYFGQWVDADLGGAFDDYVGCDVMRGLGYTYNGDAFDESGSGATGYGANPPAIACDFFEGPYQDNDGIDNAYGIGENEALNGVGYGDGVADNERFGMRRFLYHNNVGQGNPNQTDPSSGIDYYNYLRGIWLDGTKFVYGGSAHFSDGDADPNQECDFMFPGDSDQEWNWGTQGNPAPEWTEQSAGNVPFDRRFMQSAGPFTLTPGAVNNITVGIVYARANQGDPFASVEAVRVADDKAQALFDNCFKVLDGPDAPDLVIQELDRELILTVKNPSSSNNANEDYIELDPFIPENIVTSNVSFTLDTTTGQYVPDTTTTILDLDRNYVFEGYQIFQLKDATVAASDLEDPDLARLVGQSDLENGIERIINFENDEDLGASVPVEKVDGADEGIVHSFQIRDDEFAQGDRRLINHKTYYYMAVAYGYNNYKTFNPNDPNALDGQKFPYKASRKSPTGAIKAFSGIPHITTPEAGGTVLNAAYGDGPEITRIEGMGNGGLVLDFTEGSENTIVNNWSMAQPTYESNAGPIDVKVIDPLNIPEARFQLRLLEDNQNELDSATWELIVLDDILGDPNTTLDDVYAGDIISSDKSIAIGNEQIFPQFGFSIRIEQYEYIQNGSESFTELITSSIEFNDSAKQWLTGVLDADGFSPQNWIRSGTQEEPNPPNDIYDDYLGVDDEQEYEGVLGGWWAPWRLCADEPGGPVPPNFSNTISMPDVADIHSVDIVITTDQTKWTRVPVLEIQEDPVLSEGNVDKGDLRDSPSLGKDGLPDNTGNGMSWFPGYAVNLETGERLNMAFGENSWLAADNGRDMKWNPSDRAYTDLFSPVFAGMHYIYVFNNDIASTGDATRMPAYDGGAYLETALNGSNGGKIKVFRSTMWVGLPMVEDGESFMSTEARIRLRVNKPYEQWDTGQTPVNNTNPMYQWDMGALATTTDDAVAADSTLSLINVVPNPYYAYSAYETNRLDTRVKIVNLPETCTVRIYNVKGTLVRTFQKDGPQTSLDWDLKNHASVPISGGVYIIHVEVDGVGERVIKWFGALRPTDLENF